MSTPKPSVVSRGHKSVDPPSEPQAPNPKKRKKAGKTVAVRGGRSASTNPTLTSETLPKGRRCGALTKAGRPCKAYAMANGLCRMHGGGQAAEPEAVAPALTDINTEQEEDILLLTNPIVEPSRTKPTEAASSSVVAPSADQNPEDADLTLSDPEDIPRGPRKRRFSVPRALIDGSSDAPVNRVDIGAARRRR